MGGLDMWEWLQLTAGLNIGLAYLKTGWDAGDIRLFQGSI